MGGLVPKGGDRPDDFITTIDLGPPRVAALQQNLAYSLESVLLPGHFVRHRNGELWADAKADPMSELYAFDSSFVLVSGLLGHSCSLRATNFPLEFVRHKDARLYIGEYDGSGGFRGEATFEPRAAEGMDSAGAREDEGVGGACCVCFVLADCPGKYLHVDKDARVVVEGYNHATRAAYQFRVRPGLALPYDSDLGEPLLYGDSDVIVHTPLPEDVPVPGPSRPPGSPSSPAGTPSLRSPPVHGTDSVEAARGGASPVGGHAAADDPPVRGAPASPPASRGIRGVGNAAVGFGPTPGTLPSHIEFETVD